MPLFPDSGITYGVTSVPSGYWEKLGRLANTSLFYNVRNQDYGAAGDGSADDTSAIVAAWTAAPAGSVIFYPPTPSTFYRTTAALTHPAKVLHHWGPGATIKNVGASGSHVIDASGALSGCTMTGLTLDGNYPTRTSGRGLVITGSSRFAVQGVRFQNIPEMAVTVGSSSRFRFERCEFDNIKNSGIFLAEGTAAAVEHFWITDCYFTATNVANVAGHSAVQCNNQNPGGTPSMLIRHGHIRGNTVQAFTKVGMGLDLLTDSEVVGNEVYGSHTGEAMAVTGARNQNIGNKLSDSTGAAGLLLWCWAGNDQRNDDTIVQGNQCFNNGTNQGIAIVPAANNVTFTNMLIIGNRCWGSGYGIQQYTGVMTGTAFATSVFFCGNQLVGNTTGGYTFASLTPANTQFRSNMTAAGTIDF